MEMVSQDQTEMTLVKRRSKIKTLFTLMIVIGLLGLLSIGGYWWYENYYLKSEGELIESPEAPEEPQAETSTEPKTLISSSGNFTFKYPANLEVVESTGNKVALLAQKDNPETLVLTVSVYTIELTSEERELTGALIAANKSARVFEDSRGRSWSLISSENAIDLLNIEAESIDGDKLNKINFEAMKSHMEVVGMDFDEVVRMILNDFK